MSWLPDNIHEPKAGSYFKPLKGKQNRVRIICDKPLVGHVQWTSDKKPVRWKLGDPRPEDYAQGRRHGHDVQHGANARRAERRRSERHCRAARQPRRIVER